MDFELSEELVELQASVRRLSQDKVRPRAREIDDTGEYPQDLFEVSLCLHKPVLLFQQAASFNLALRVVRHQSDDS